MNDQSISANATTLTRDELYDLVWQTPMVRLGERFGISDVGLRKICKRLDVPTPPAGWWAKKAAGKPVRATSLPEGRAGIPKQATITPTPDDTGDLRGSVRRKAEQVGAIEIPERLTRPHPVIAGWIEDHRKRQEEARRQRREWPRISWTVPDFTEAERRRHRVLNALFRALERHGATVSEDDRRHLFAELSGEKIEFSCHEKSKQTFRPLTEDEKRWRSDKDALRQELQPTGRLEFRIRAWIDQPLRKIWLETERQSAESMLPEIVATFLVLGPLLAERTRRREEQQRIWDDQQRQREIERQKRQQDDNRFRRLIEIAERAKRAELAREFIARLRTLDRPETEPIDGRTIAEWLDWAEAKADEVDPVGKGLEAIFHDLAKVSAWSYRDS